MNSDCIEDCKHSVVAVRGEHQMIARFANPKRRKYTKYRLDGCLQERGTAADWAVVEDRVGMIVVELKGRHVEHGIKQVRESLEYMRSLGFNGPAGALVVSTEVPRAAVKNGKMVRDFYRFTKCHLHLHSSKRDFTVAELLAA